MMTNFTVGRRRNSTRPGITLIELLVVIFVLGLLAALLLPAVQSSRESARRIQCLSNLRQIGLAVSSYATDHGSFPPSGTVDEASYLVRLLPYVEQSDLYSQFNFSVPIGDQVPLAIKRPAVYGCPTDPAVASYRFRSNYFGNCGWYERVSSDPDLPRVAVGPIPYITSSLATSPAHVSDGLSSTVAIAECLPGFGNDIRRAVWQETPSLPIFDRGVTTMGAECLAATTATFLFPRGMMWTPGGFGITMYDHVLPPNTRHCAWVVNSGSMHSGGINAALCDGSARFFSSSVDAIVWRSLGTRAGGETVSVP